MDLIELMGQLRPGDRVFRWWKDNANKNDNHSQQPLTVIRVNKISIGVLTDQGNYFRLPWYDLAGRVNWEEDERRCPDAGKCHHSCDPSDCFRVRTCEPLSGTFANDDWPATIRNRYTSRSLHERSQG
jgi:hypothetical protein